MRGTMIGLLFVLLWSMSAKAVVYNQEVWQALTKGGDFNVILKIVDDEGSPVEGAKVSGWMFIDNNKDHGSHYSYLSYSNGLVDLKGKCGEYVRVVVKKNGYYTTMFEIKYPMPSADKCIVDGKWQPYGETKEVILKKIKNPVRIGEFGRCSVPIPVYDQWVGFDLELREWVPPYGKGNYSDVMLKFGRELIHRQTDFKMTMDVSFENNKYAGCYLMNVDSFSEKKTVYKADENANFIPTMSFIQERHPGAKRIDNRIDKDSYLVFRTRTKVDEKGNLISAHYGIIRGEWAFFNSMLSAGYLFNPISNNTNLEDAETARKARMNN